MQAERGFSLIETMLAILILGTGLVGLTHGITGALRASKESELQTKAALFAAGQIEILRAESFILEGETDGDCGSGLANYGWRQTVTPGSIEGLFDVQVVVQESDTGKEVYTLRTLLFDQPLSSTDEETKKKPTERPRR
jgi:prepilin-type N-terminal cleavage/methylation domain-containing protein